MTMMRTEPGRERRKRVSIDERYFWMNDFMGISGFLFPAGRDLVSLGIIN
jgi:hypothetical protein